MLRLTLYRNWIGHFSNDTIIVRHWFLSNPTTELRISNIPENVQEKKICLNRLNFKLSEIRREILSFFVACVNFKFTTVCVSFPKRPNRIHFFRTTSGTDHALAHDQKSPTGPRGPWKRHRHRHWCMCFIIILCVTVP